MRLDVSLVSNDDGMIVTPMLTTSIRSVYKLSIISERELKDVCDGCAGIRRSGCVVKVEV